MMTKSFRIALVFLLFAIPFSAQAQGPFGVFTGYSYTNWQLPLSCVRPLPTRSDIECPNPTGQRLRGWEVSVEGRLIPHLELVADFSGHYGTELIDPPDEARVRLYTLLAGPKLSASSGRFSPFVHGLVGAANAHNGASSSGELFPFPRGSFSFASAVGGGVDYHIIPLVSARVQADWLLTS